MNDSCPLQYLNESHIDVQKLYAGFAGSLFTSEDNTGKTLCIGSSNNNTIGIRTGASDALTFPPSVK